MKEELKDIFASCVKHGSFYDFDKSEYNYNLDSELLFIKLEAYIINKEKESFEAGSLYLSEEPIYETFEDYKNKKPTEFVFTNKS